MTRSDAEFMKAVNKRVQENRKQKTLKNRKEIKNKLQLKNLERITDDAQSHFLNERLNKVDRKFKSSKVGDIFGKETDKKRNVYTGQIEDDEQYKLRKESEKQIEKNMEDDIKTRFHKLSKPGRSGPGGSKRKKSKRKKKKKKSKRKSKRK